jgi:nitrite reductase/ring-hydroxylating ferredoxin subunit
MTISGHDHHTFTGFPMPRDPQALVDRDRRPIVRSPRAEPRFPFPVPNGWFVVAEARDLEPGEMRTFKVFGEDLVLFRGDEGAPHMVDAFCAHLGAHMAVGGRVDAGCIRCPFHGGATTATPASATRSLTATWVVSRARPASARTRASSATG